MNLGNIESIGQKRNLGEKNDSEESNGKPLPYYCKQIYLDVSVKSPGVDL